MGEIILSYAGVPLCVSTPEIEAWVAQNFRLSDIFSFQHIYHSTIDTSRHSMVPFPDLNREVELGTLFWPYGATRWCHGHFICSSSQLELIKVAVAPKSRALLYMAWVDASGATKDQVKTLLWLLPPRPLATVGDGRFKDLHLITLVCERYYWWLQSAFATAAPGPGKEWEKVFGLITKATGDPIIVDPIMEGYELAGNKKCFTGGGHLPIQVEPWFTTVGYRCVRKLNGEFFARSRARSEADLAANLGRMRSKISGGFIQEKDREAPEEYKVLLMPPEEDHVNWFDLFGPIGPVKGQGDPNEITKRNNGRLVHIVSLGEMDARLPGGASISDKPVDADGKPLEPPGPGATPEEVNAYGKAAMKASAAATAKATKDPEAAAKVAAWMKKTFEDWLKYRLFNNVDCKWAGLQAWSPEGHHDVKWTVRLTECSTRVMPGPQPESCWWYSSVNDTEGETITPTSEEISIEEGDHDDYHIHKYYNNVRYTKYLLKPLGPVTLGGLEMPETDEPPLPTGLPTAKEVEGDEIAPRKVGAKQEHGQTVYLANTSDDQYLTLAHDSLTSKPENRFDLPNKQDLVMWPGETFQLQYWFGRWHWDGKRCCDLFFRWPITGGKKNDTPIKVGKNIFTVVGEGETQVPAVSEPSLGQPAAAPDPAANGKLLLLPDGKLARYRDGDAVLPDGSIAGVPAGPIQLADGTTANMKGAVVFGGFAPDHVPGEGEKIIIANDSPFASLYLNHEDQESTDVCRIQTPTGKQVAVRPLEAVQVEFNLRLRGSLEGSPGRFTLDNKVGVEVPTQRPAVNYAGQVWARNCHLKYACADDPGVTAQAGTGTITQAGTTVTGTGTLFLSEVVVGDTISAGPAGGISGTVDAIASNTSLTLDTSTTSTAGYPFTVTPRTAAIDGTGTLAQSARTVTGTSSKFTTEVMVGDRIVGGSISGRVTSITSDTSLTLDISATASASTYTVSPASDTVGAGLVTQEAETVTGTGTLFECEVSPGDKITAPGISGYVQTVPNNTTLTLDSAASQPIPQPYTIEPQKALRTYTVERKQNRDRAYGYPSVGRKGALNWLRMIGAGTIPARLLGTGTPGSSNYLRGDGAWSSVPNAGDMLTTSVYAAVSIAGTTTTTFLANGLAWNYVSGAGPYTITLYDQVTYSQTMIGFLFAKGLTGTVTIEAASGTIVQAGATATTRAYTASHSAVFFSNGTDWVLLFDTL